MKATQKASVMTLVKNLINKKSETKYVTRLPENNVGHNSAISAGDIIPITPLVAQGTEDYQRLGDSIKPISMVVRGHLSIRGGAAYTNKVLLARVMVLSAKSYKTDAAIVSNAAAIANSLLRPNYEGGPYVIQFGGATSDLYQPVNADAYRVHYDKIIEIAPSTADGGLEEQPASCKRWRAKIPLPATLNYDTTTAGDEPTNFAPFLCVGYAFADGTSPDVLTTRLLSTNSCVLKYKDF